MGDFLDKLDRGGGHGLTLFQGLEHGSSAVGLGRHVKTQGRVVSGVVGLQEDYGSPQSRNRIGPNLHKGAIVVSEAGFDAVISGGRKQLRETDALETCILPLQIQPRYKGRKDFALPRSGVGFKKCARCRQEGDVLPDPDFDPPRRSLGKHIKRGLLGRHFDTINVPGQSCADQ
ncbi:hypothetical protein GCM10011402_35910 [Paracoccus acridae]|uniref:Uncharacterized protein n=1 Tax=Paracoccus acridae TaxID=1795310 RepID=A0ABQ1VM22_9RHOB|nr:hypothetical protein GCM10011402_35910 [Paracoccus acridae]